MLHVVMQNVIMLYVILIYVVMLNLIMMNAMLNTLILFAVVLNVVVLTAIQAIAIADCFIMMSAKNSPNPIININLIVCKCPLHEAEYLIVSKLLVDYLKIKFLDALSSLAISIRFLAAPQAPLSLNTFYLTWIKDYLMGSGDVF
jgi:hypothetical protein